MTKFTLPYHIVNAINALEDADCGAAYKAINAYIQSEGKLDLATLSPTIRCIILLAQKDLDKIIKRNIKSEERKLIKSKLPADPDIPESDLARGRDIMSIARQHAKDRSEIEILVNQLFKERLRDCGYERMIPYPDGDFRLIRRAG